MRCAKQPHIYYREGCVQGGVCTGRGVYITLTVPSMNPVRSRPPLSQPLVVTTESRAPAAAVRNCAVASRAAAAVADLTKKSR